MADPDETYKQQLARSKRVSERALNLALTPDEVDTLLAYLAGGAPDALDRALDYVERKHRGGRSDQGTSDNARQGDRR